MIPRQTVNEKLTFGIKPGKEYKPFVFCTWKELIETKGLLPADQIDDLIWDEMKESGFMKLDFDPDHPKIFYTPSIIVIRPRPENDEEYEARMKRDEENRKTTEERERLEYLRLKAKFENK